MSRRAKIHANERLYPLPTDEAVIAAVRDICDEMLALGRLGPGDAESFGPTAQAIAHRLGLESARRLGNQANGPMSFTGYMAPALRIAPRLRSLQDRGLLRSRTGYRSRRHWALTLDGKQLLADKESR